MSSLIAQSLAAMLLVLSPGSSSDPQVDANENTFDVEEQTSDDVHGRGGGAATEATSPYVSFEARVFCQNDPSLNEIEPCRGPRSCGAAGTVYNLFGFLANGTRHYLGQICDEPGDASPEAPALTLAMVAQAFREVPLPPSTISIQPPGGRTLVNLPTILSTDAGAFTETVTLLGQRVTLDITPTAYRWVHGDGTEQTSDWAGVAYAKKRPMSDYLAHTYLRADQGLPARVDTTWSARFRVNGGPWRPVPDTVTIAGEPVSIEVVEASPILVGYQ